MVFRPRSSRNPRRASTPIHRRCRCAHLENGTLVAKILVADDEPDLRDALRRVCEADGHEVITATDGRETVELARSARPDLVVLDNRMPVLSGLDALSRMREFDPELTVVLFTAYDAMDGWMYRAVQA